MQGLQIQLILALLLDHFQVWSQGGFRDRLGIIVIVLLTFNEGLGVFGRDYPGLKAKLT